MDKIINIERLPEIISTAEIRRLLQGKATKRMLTYAINAYLKEKAMVKIKRGLYSKTPNAFYVASRIYDGYVGFSSALYLHGLKTEMESVIYVCVDGSAKSTRFMNRTILPVNMSGLSYGTELISAEGRDVLTSTFPKTVFDMFCKPRYASYFDLYRAINRRGVGGKEWAEIYGYTEKAGLSTARRIGYGLEHLAPGGFTEKLRARSDSGSGSSFFFKHKAVNYASGWKLFDDIRLERWKNAV